MKYTLSLPAEGEWIEMERRICTASKSSSLPAEGEWIEIYEFPVRSRIHQRLSLQRESGLKFKQIQ